MICLMENNNFSKKWGLLMKLQFLQGWSSRFISFVNPAIIHNLEKYYAIKKALYLSLIEDIDGDYIEFGVFEGSSFSHAIKCYLNLKKFKPKKQEICFFGFDSFEGFGELDNSEHHPFYQDLHFECSYNNVIKRISKISKNVKFRLIKGFFKSTLATPSDYYGIKKARIIFIDCDTYSSALLALNFCINIIIPGTILILDDYFSYRGSSSKGVAGAFNMIKSKNNINFREIFSYGMGGKVFICDELAKSN